MMLFKNKLKRLKNFKREIKFLYQRWVRGWDDSETWNLDISLSKLILPRLKRFKELNTGCPVLTEGFGHIKEMDNAANKEKWNSIIDDMIFAFDYYANEKQFEYPLNEKDDARAKNGMQLFAKHFESLWW